VKEEGSGFVHDAGIHGFSVEIDSAIVFFIEA
jgi:hypothetical protein